MARALTFSQAAVGTIALGFLGLLTACGGGEATTQTASSNPVDNGSVAANTAPRTSAAGLSLSGTPDGLVYVGSAYAFTPTVSGTSGSSTYSITNKPSWATFDPTTGALKGTPGANDVGDYKNIGIAVASSGGTASLASFTITVSTASPTSTTGTATLSWVPPTQNMDGSSATNLAGYNIYYGASASSLDKKIQVQNAGLTSYTVSDLGTGTHYFGISAYTTNGVEGELSVVGSKTIM